MRRVEQLGHLDPVLLRRSRRRQAETQPARRTEVGEAETDGRRGGFAVQHTGTMRARVPDLSITVVPGSSIEGTSGVEVTDGGPHSVLDYTLP